MGGLGKRREARLPNEKAILRKRFVQLLGSLGSLYIYTYKNSLYIYRNIYLNSETLGAIFRAIPKLPKLPKATIYRAIRHHVAGRLLGNLGNQKTIA